MSREPKAQLWRLAQTAFDGKRLASADPAVLDHLLEFPELALEMDSILLVEQRLQALQPALADVSTRSRSGWVKLALAVAALLMLWLFAPRESVRPDMGLKPDSDTSMRSQPVVLIGSYELAIVRSRAPGKAAAATPEIPGPAILTLTSTRTRSAPRGVNHTY